MRIQRAVTVVLCFSLGCVSFTHAIGAELPTPKIDNIFEGFVNKLMNMSLFNQELNSVSTSEIETNDRIILTHLVYCGQEGLLPGQTCNQNDPSLENGDIQVSTLLEVPTIPDGGLGTRNGAAQAFVRNMTQSRNTFGTYNYADVQGEKKIKEKADDYARGLLNAAAMSAPAASFATMYASRKMGTTYKDQTNPDATESSLISYMDQISGRIQDLIWINDKIIKVTDALALQRTQAIMQAEQLFMESQKYKQGERIEALLATIAVQNQRQIEADEAMIAQKKAAMENAKAMYSPQKP